MNFEFLYLFFILSICSLIFYKFLYFYFEKQIFLFSLRSFSHKKFIYHTITVVIPLYLLHNSIEIDLFIIIIALFFYERKKIYIFSNGILIGLSFIKWNDFDEISFNNNNLKMINNSRILYKGVYSIKIEKDLKEHFKVLTSKSFYKI